MADCLRRQPLFQFTPLREGRHHYRWEPRSHEISIHAPPRGATAGGAGVASAEIFQFTPLREGRLCQALFNYAEVLFQFTPLREGRHALISLRSTLFFFNSRPPGWGDGTGTHRKDCERISIHAPPRGATPSLLAFSNIARFQFTPLREGRLESETNGVLIATDFNSRPSARGDAVVLMTHSADLISIHAPPRGATSCTALHGGAFFISIHAPPRGATPHCTY